MGWSLRKSFGKGPLKVNLSTGRGISVSTGVRGARVSLGADGRAEAAGGRGIFRFRKSLNGKRRRGRAGDDGESYDDAPRSGLLGTIKAAIFWTVVWAVVIVGVFMAVMVHATK